MSPRKLNVCRHPSIAIYGSHRPNFLGQWLKKSALQVRVRKKQVQEFELERNSLQKFQKLELKKRQKNSKVTVRQKKAKKV